MPAIKTRKKRRSVSLRRVTTRAVLLLGTLVLGCGEHDRAYKGRSAAVWGTQLTARSPADRVEAANALYHIAPRSPEIVDALLTAMRDTSAEVQTAVAIALGTVGPRALPGLTEAVRDDHAEVRGLAIRLLAAQGVAAIGSVDAIATALRDSSELVRREAAVALGKFAAGARQASAPLSRCASSGSPELRAACLNALASVNPSDPTFAPLVHSFLDDDAAIVRRAALNVLGRGGSTEGSANWLRLLDDPDPSVRIAAYQLLDRRSAGAAATMSRALLRKGLADRDSTIRTMVRSMLAPRPAPHPEGEEPHP